MTSKVIEGHKSFFLCLKINFFRWNSCSPSLSSPLLLLLSLYASLSFFSLSFFFSISLFSIPSPTLHRPYIHPMPLYLFSLPHSSSLFLRTYFNLNLRFMDNFLSLFFFIFRLKFPYTHNTNFQPKIIINLHSQFNKQSLIKLLEEASFAIEEAIMNYKDSITTGIIL